MKILLIRNYPSYVNVVNKTYNLQQVGLAKALIRKGHQCDIVFWTNKEEEDVDINVGEYGTIHVFYRHGKTRLKNTVFTGCDALFDKYDVLQTMEYNQIMSWIMAKKYAEKMVIYHGPYYSKFNKRYNSMCRLFDMFFLKRYKRLNTKFLVKSELAKEFLLDKGIESRNISVLGVGIDTEMLSTKESSSDVSLISKMREDKQHKLLYIGKFEKRRNILFMLDVFNLVHKKYPETKLYLIGDGSDEYLKTVWEKINILNLQDSIVYERKMEQKYLSEVYSLSDIFLLPTHYEIFGMVLLESMYYKSVAITSKNGGSSVLINSGTNGYIVDNFDVNEWAKTIERLLNDKKLEDIIKISAHDTIANHFTWDALADRFIDEYNNI